MLIENDFLVQTKLPHVFASELKRYIYQILVISLFSYNVIL